MNEQTTTPDVNQPMGELGTGSAGRWHVSVVESLDGRSCYLELDGPWSYLCVRLHDLSAVGGLQQFLQSPSPREKFALGQLGDLLVWLVWDDEDFIRCFLVVGEQKTTTLRLSLDSDDVRLLAEALGQAVEDLPEA